MKVGNEIWKPVVGYEGFYEVSNKHFQGKAKTVKGYVFERIAS